MLFLCVYLFHHLISFTVFIPLLYVENIEVEVEAMRALGNFTQSENARNILVQTDGKFLIQFQKEILLSTTEECGEKTSKYFNYNGIIATFSANLPDE